ncbi:uncharacterized protein MONBRDRAFT_23975 [Monosiga brevicollis MX1]|uniref:Uncharacterized protein n=1 Tax=Monosiga brevicollis TaxID=81824 RepID=A9UUB5_MONBE|nr:uncharacterized protein MONBRDRAFT_23975 [Monosiga brevicollis MX1]EDQ91066.1 predicted protein [Monosiga brevicollis MX1]|eukprot:XP_001744363.1 hypothetical protein [Monosiga brevicollis MX1]
MLLLNAHALPLEHLLELLATRGCDLGEWARVSGDPGRDATTKARALDLFQTHLAPRPQRAPRRRTRKKPGKRLADASENLSQLSLSESVLAGPPRTPQAAKRSKIDQPQQRDPKGAMARDDQLCPFPGLDNPMTAVVLVLQQRCLSSAIPIFLPLSLLSLSPLSLSSLSLLSLSPRLILGHGWL